MVFSLEGVTDDVARAQTSSRPWKGSRARRAREWPRGAARLREQRVLGKRVGHQRRRRALRVDERQELGEHEREMTLVPAVEIAWHVNLPPIPGCRQTHAAMLALPACDGSLERRPR